MSLKEFLAVGRSFAGSPRERSPFEMRKEVRLPIFDNSRRFSSRQAVALQTDWLAEKPHAPAAPQTSDPAVPVHLKPGPAPAPAPAPAPKPRLWLRILTLGLLGKSKTPRTLVQCEMNLENVRVIRNDLSDSDLEIVVKKKKKKFALRTVQVEEPAQPKRNPARTRGEWSELSARLFEIGQR